MAISENLINDALSAAFVVSERSADALEAAVNVLEEQYEYIDVIAAANGLLASALSALYKSRPSDAELENVAISATDQVSSWMAIDSTLFLTCLAAAYGDFGGANQLPKNLLLVVTIVLLGTILEDDQSRDAAMAARFGLIGI